MKLRARSDKLVEFYYTLNGPLPRRQAARLYAQRGTRRQWPYLVDSCSLSPPPKDRGRKDAVIFDNRQLALDAIALNEKCSQVRPAQPAIIDRVFLAADMIASIASLIRFSRSRRSCFFSSFIGRHLLVSNCFYGPRPGSLHCQFRRGRRGRHPL
ncbi:hypothetical protein WJ0W_005706 [Paenibacillus melissococcoides]|uniref:Uncharacterized protein n=1 Tax=Paenibacillus melissococcoides TaxID=2912268 RepID=A0ABM9G9R8_9BACL|nr:hypothetical protein [Paenibacillus melissococcoides]CAH8248524.1 hypothetical protein WJ0W_005706 [Paenibacillus melissococcoides]